LFYPLYVQSWTYWDTASGGAFWDSNGNLILEVISYFARPYPLATCGKPQKLHFDVATKVFDYEYILDPSIVFSTEIMIPSVQYPNLEYQVQVSEGLKWDVSAFNPNVIVISSDFVVEKTHVWVKVQP
jgi:hypothetical protein